MFHIKGNFNGQYQAKQDDKFGKGLYHYKYFIRILPNGIINNAYKIDSFETPEILGGKTNSFFLTFKM